MVLRWCAAGMVEAGRRFRRVNVTCTTSDAHVDLVAAVGATLPGVAG
jgi:hypothetical protein